MKILIVEDEQHSREHLAALLCDRHEILQADNVPRAVETLMQEQPELVLTDICMPQKNGIELAAFIAKNYPQTVVVMITGFSDFQYTKAAIEYGVFDYILKPVSRDNLYEIIHKAAKKIAEEKRKEELQSIFQKYFSENLTLLCQQHFENLLFRRLSDLDHIKGENVLRFRHGPFRLIAIRSVNLNEDLSLEGEYYVTTYLKKYILRKKPNTVASTFGNIMYWIWAIEPGNAYEDNIRLNEFLTELHRDVQKRFFCSLSVGISNLAENQKDMYLLRKQALEVIGTEQDGGIFFYEDLGNENDSSQRVRYDLNELIALIKKGNRERVRDVLKKILDSGFTEDSPHTGKLVEMMVGTITFSLCSTDLYSEEIRTSSQELMHRVVQGQNIDRQKFESWICAVCDAVQNMQVKKGDCLVDTILQYINDNYNKAIGLEEVSRMVRRNSSYLSRLVKEKTDKSFTVLLTERRLEAAKHLLKHSTKKIQAVAAEVGYPNPNYFNRVFKQAVGMNPNEYRLIAAAFRVS